MTRSSAEVARLFGVRDAARGANIAGHVWPGNPGLVMANRALRSMVWGFPLVLKSKRTGQPLKPRPVNNARSENLKSDLWKASFAERRCLIPLEAWAEAEGPKGGKTRTWLSLPDSDLFAVAGIWRPSEEFGHCYSMIMTDAAGPVAEIHDRMPVVLRASDYDQWLDGSPDDAKALCTSFSGDLAIDRTSDSWT